MSFNPRWYQSEAVDALFNFFDTTWPMDDAGNIIPLNPVLALPTGTGKSLVIAMIIHRAISTYPTTRILMLTHVAELIRQNAEELLSIWPDAPLGIYSAGLKRREYLSQIVYAGVQSLIKIAAQLGRFDLVIVDEAHLIGPNDETMYQKLMSVLKLANPWVKVIGLTATPYRKGIGTITENGIFTKIVYDITALEQFNRLVREGYLCPLINKRTHTTLDVSNVGITNGDYNNKELQTAVKEHGQTDAIVDETMYYGADRHSWLTFASGVDHAEELADAFERRGVPTATIHSKNEATVNAKRIEAFRAGELRNLVNNNVLTTGFNHRPVDLISMVRPTTSSGLWVQMLGRGTRTSPETGKLNCIVLDFAGNTPRLGPVNDPIVPKMKKGMGGDAPVWACPACGSYNHARAPHCIYCGEVHVFGDKLSRHAGTDDVMISELPVIEWFKVQRTFYRRHVKEGKPDSICVTYTCGIRGFQEWVMLEHGGLVAHKAREWWRQRFAGEPPETTEQALQYVSLLKEPVRISVHTNTKWPRVVDVEF